MATLPDGRIAIPVAVEDHEASFMVDTGGVSATMTQQLARDLGHSPQITYRWLVGVAGSLLDSYVRVDDFSIGRLKGDGLPVYLDPRISSLGIDGTLAPDMLDKFDVDLDFAHGTLSLFSSDHCPGKVVYWTRDYAVVPMTVDSDTGHIRIPVTVNGKTIMAMLDTGATTSVMSMDAAKLIGVAENSSDLKLTSSFGVNQRYKEYSYPFQSLSFEGVTVLNPHITVMSNETLKGLGKDMIIGMGILRQLHLYVAYKEQKLYITPALAN